MVLVSPLFLAIVPFFLSVVCGSAPPQKRSDDTPTYDLFKGTHTQQKNYAEDTKAVRFTSENGAPLPAYFDIQRAGIDGPLLMQSTHLIDSLAHFVRERIPERIVHARGFGAMGTLHIETDFAEQYSMADVFKKGTRTWALCRFSTVGGAQGSPDVARDPRGFACKFKTRHGVLDWVFNNTPVFFLRNPLKFPPFIHTQKTNPQTNERDPNMVFDYLWQNPEASLQFLRLFSDLGTPHGARHMDGWSGHTYRLVKKDGSWVYCKVKLETNQGVKNFTAAEATTIAGQNQEWATKDLFDAIARKDYPSWKVKMAVKTLEEARAYRYDVNDLTKDWIDAKWNDVGTLTLHQNPRNYFDEIEQSHFSPSNMVAGWTSSEDPVLQARLFSYNDAGRHRLGPNYRQLPINCPFSRVGNFDRSGSASIEGDNGARANYPTSANGAYILNHDNVGAAPYIRLPNNSSVETYSGASNPNEDLDYEQPRQFFQHQLDDVGREHLYANFAGALINVSMPGVQQHMLDLFRRIDPALARGVLKAMSKLNAKATSHLHA